MSSCEHGNEPSGFIKGRKFHDQLSYYQFLKKFCATWGLSGSQFIYLGSMLPFTCCV
jgi:hypothetical protein